MKFKVHSKERLYFVIMMMLSLAGYSICLSVLFAGKVAGSTLGFYVVFFLLCRLLAPILFLGYLKGNAIKINENQFPDIFRILQAQSKELGLRKVPDIYLLQGGGVLNAFATRLAGRNFVILFSDVLEVAYQEGVDAVSFIIGHELGHIKRSHVGFIESFLIGPAKLIPFLGSAYSRACEYTCDNIGFSLCPEGAEKGLLVLAAGKTLYKKVNTNELLLNSASELGFAVWLAEIISSHPVLLKRIASLNKLDNNRAFKGPIFKSPKVNLGNIEAQR